MKLRFLFSIIGLLCLFNALDAQTDPVNIDLNRAPVYQLGPGDEITGKVTGEQEYNFVSTISEDGTLDVPFSDKPVMAQCKTVRDLKLELTSLLAKYLREPQLSLQMRSNSRPPSAIYGEVREPRRDVLLVRKVTLLEFLSFAGGATEEASGTIQVFRPQAPICTDSRSQDIWKPASNIPGDVPSRLYTLADLRLGREDANPVIYPGDIVVVDKAKPIYIVGEVVAPQGIYLRQGGMSLSQALAKVGGIKREAKKDITIKRLKPGSTGEYELISANYELIRKGEQKDIALQPYDIVEVDHSKDSFGVALGKMIIGAGKTTLTTFTSSGAIRILY